MWHIVIESVCFFCGQISAYTFAEFKSKVQDFCLYKHYGSHSFYWQLCLILCSRVSSTWRETEQWQPAHRCDSGISWSPQELNSSTLLLLCAKAHVYLLLYL